MAGGWWRQLLSRFDAPPIPDPLWRRALAACPLAQRLDESRQLALRKLSAAFLVRKRFHALAGATLDERMRLLIAMQACLPALEQGTHGLQGWRELLVYPGEF